MRPTLICLTAATIIICGAAFAAPATSPDITKQIAKCAAIKGDLMRLECFDTLARGSKLAGPQPLPTKTTGTGKWQVSRDKNPIDDSERVTLILVSDSARSQFGEAIAFVARCQSGKTEAYINWNDFLGDDSSSVYETWKTVTVRIGSEKAQTQRWDVSSDSKATFAPGGGSNLLKSMARADTFLAQTTPYNENPVTVTFDTRGLANALKPLAQACNWKME